MDRGRLYEVARDSECIMYYVCEWRNKWEMEFNAKKSHILRIGKCKNNH